MNALALSISNTPIHQDDQGRYSLNDLHKAAGRNQKQQPTNFLRLDSTKALAAEINRSSDLRSAIEVVNGGKTPGTYVAKELVYAYAMWVSPAFSLQVIRTFDAVATQPTAIPADLTRQLAALQAEFLRTNPRLQDVLNLTRLGYSQPRIGDMLHLARATVYRDVKRLRDCGFATTPRTALLEKV